MSGNRINISVAGNESSYVKPLIRDLRHLKGLLLGMQLPPDTIRKIITYASGYPTGSLEFFWKRIQDHINRANRELQEDLITAPLADDSPKIEKPIIKRKSILDDVEPIFEKSKEEFLPPLVVEKPVFNQEEFMRQHQESLKSRIKDLIEKEDK